MKKITFFLFYLAFILPGFLSAQIWSSIPGLPSLTGKAMAVYNGSLYITGFPIGILSGTSWTSAGTTGMTGNSYDPSGNGTSINTLEVYDGFLYAAGNFAFADGNADTCIARWNGFSWFDVPGSWGGPPDHRCGDIYAMGVSNSVLYVGGLMCGIQKHIVAWGSFGWSAGNSPGGTVLSICEYNGVLYAGFEFGIAKFVSGNWLAVGSGSPVGGVSSMAVINNELYVGGNAGSGIAKWNGSTWSNLGSGLGLPFNNLKVSSIKFYAGEIYVTGDFRTAGGIPANYIARWNGTSWSALGSGLDGPGDALAVYNGDLYVSGQFFTAGGNSSPKLAKWNTSSCPSSITANGSTSICQGSSATLNANPGIGFNYQWKLNGSNISGATSSTYAANSAGNYICVVTNGCSSTSNTINISVNPLPSATINPNGNLNFCTGPGITLQANTGTGLTYQWRKNSVNISGATNSSYLANSTGSFNVVVTNSLGCSKGATPVNVTSPPSITITSSGATHFCTGGSVTLTAASGQTVTYKWKKNGAYITGATNATYVATSTGSYNCVITNSFGCSKGGTPITVTGPPGAVITANGPTTFCAGGSVQLSAAGGYTYQWIKNSGNINGATQQNYTATTAGNYKVKVTDPFGCSKTTPNSNQVTVSIPCRESNIEQSLSPFKAIIFPNPSSDEFELTVSNNEKTSIVIHDLSGRILFQNENFINDHQLKFGLEFENGIYIAEIVQGGEKQIFKISKSK